MTPIETLRIILLLCHLVAISPVFYGVIKGNLNQTSRLVFIYSCLTMAITSPITSFNIIGWICLPIYIACAWIGYIGYLHAKRIRWISITTSDKNLLKKGDTITWSTGTGNSEGRVMKVDNNIVHVKPINP